MNFVSWPSGISNQLRATADNYLRASNAASAPNTTVHARLWPGHAHDLIGKDRKQYVVIAAGGHGGLQTKAGDYVEAFALP